MTPLTLSCSEARQKLAGAIKTCVDNTKPIVIKSRAREVVMIPRDEYDAWMETMHQLDTPANVRHLEQSLTEKQRGEAVVMTAAELAAYMNSPEHELSGT